MNKIYVSSFGVFMFRPNRLIKVLELIVNIRVKVLYSALTGWYFKSNSESHCIYIFINSRWRLPPMWANVRHLVLLLTWKGRSTTVVLRYMPVRIVLRCDLLFTYSGYFTYHVVILNHTMAHTLTEMETSLVYLLYCVVPPMTGALR